MQRQRKPRSRTRKKEQASAVPESASKPIRNRRADPRARKALRQAKLLREELEEKLANTQGEQRAEIVLAEFNRLFGSEYTMEDLRSADVLLGQYMDSLRKFVHPCEWEKFVAISNQYALYSIAKECGLLPKESSEALQEIDDTVISEKAKLAGLYIGGQP